MASRCVGPLGLMACWALLSWGTVRAQAPTAAVASGVAAPVAAGAGAAVGPSVLARPVRFAQTRTLTLAQALSELSRQSGVPISYSSTRIGAARRCQLRAGAARPLGEVLAEVLGQRGVSAGLLGGQLVLWARVDGAPPGVASLVLTNRRLTLPVVVKTAGPPGASMAEINQKPTITATAGSRPVPQPGRVALASESQPPKHFGVGLESQKTSLQFPSQSAVKTHSKTSSSCLAAAAQLQAERGAKRAASVSRAGENSRPRRTETLTDILVSRSVGVLPSRLAVEGSSVPVLATVALVEVAVPLRPARRQRWGQVSLVPPLSTNGLSNARTVNKLSLNLVAGYAAGVQWLELGGALNVVRDSVRGFQAAGLGNITGTEVRGVQLAGLGNIGGGGVRGVQAAGFLNLNRDDVRGVQLAGLLNLTGGAARARLHPAQPTRVRRWLGLPRLLATDAFAALPAAPSANQPGMLVQLAGLANLTGTDVRGLQSAPLLNVARRVRGVQLGLVNVARDVRGSQIGLVNIADSLSGAPIGLINIVRRNGYRRGEVWASESLPLNAVFKMGTRRCYFILGAAAEPFGNRVQWAAGSGLGTAGRPHGRFTLSLDLLQWTLAGSSSDFDAAQVDDRLLTQLRPTIAWQIEANGHLQLVVAPTFNLAVAWQNDGQPDWDFGSNQWLWIETAGPQSQTRLWPGLQVGLRF